MFEKLDTLIAFAVVMLGVSLIITILTQLVSTLLGLRGGNLLWGIEILLGDLDPSLAADLAAAFPAGGSLSSVRKLAEEILTDKLISDSTFSRAGNMWLIGPVVRRVMNAPVLGWLIQRWRCASAIRPEELARMLDKKAAVITGLAAAMPGGPAAAAARAATTLTNLLTAADPETDRQLVRLKTALTAFVPLGPPAAPPPAGVPAVPALPTGYAVQVDKIFQKATDAAERSVGKLETWFNTVMNRVSQRFVVQIRLWTVAFAFAIAFGAQLDSVSLIDQLSNNPSVRSALVNMRDGMLNEANVVLPPPGAAANASEVPVSPTILNEALDKLKAGNRVTATVDKIPDSVTTVNDAIEWLNQQSGVPASAAPEYRKSVVSVLRAHAVAINQDLVKAGVQLIPSPYPGVIHPYGKRNFLGIFGAAALLSLGAPFWYNALKNLSNLRTVVATKEAQERKA